MFYLITLQNYFLGHGLALRRKIFNKEIETLHMCFLTPFLVDSVFAWIISVILICSDSIAYELDNQQITATKNLSSLSRKNWLLIRESFINLFQN